MKENKEEILDESYIKRIMVRKSMKNDDVIEIYYTLGFGCLTLMSKEKIIIEDLVAIFIKDVNLSRYCKLDNIDISKVNIIKTEDGINLKHEENSIIKINLDLDSYKFTGDKISIPLWCIPYIISIQFPSLFRCKSSDIKLYNNFEELEDITVNQIFMDNKELVKDDDKLLASIKKFEKIYNKRILLERYESDSIITDSSSLVPIINEDVLFLLSYETEYINKYIIKTYFVDDVDTKKVEKTNLYSFLYIKLDL